MNNLKELLEKIMSCFLFRTDTNKIIEYNKKKNKVKWLDKNESNNYLVFNNINNDLKFIKDMMDIIPLHGIPIELRHMTPYIRHSKIDAKEWLDIVKYCHEKGLEKITINNQIVKTTSLRYHTFIHSGTKCKFCGLEGTYFWIERGKNNSRNIVWHLNLYGLDNDGNEILLTKDHIIPKVAGGQDKLNNLQTLCTICNSKKGSISNNEYIHKLNL